MDYVYLNVDTQLEIFYNALPIDKKNHLTELDISLNIDGLPLFKSSSTSLWPVLCAVKNVTPVQVFPLALACGPAKPADLDFLKDVIADLKKLLTSGLPVCSVQSHLVYIFISLSVISVNYPKCAT